jgi:hypothetical protein
MLAALTEAPGRAAADSRGHLEANMAAALSLESPQEYRRWLLTYARFLSGDTGAEPSSSPRIRPSSKTDGSQSYS